MMLQLHKLKRRLLKFYRKTPRKLLLIGLAILALGTTLGTFLVLRQTLAPSFRKAPKDSPYLFTAQNKLFQLNIGSRADSQPTVDFSVADKGVSFTLTGLSKEARTPQVKGKTLIYPDIFPAIDLTYTTLSKGVKEELIIKTPSAGHPTNFLFDLKLTGATLSSIHRESLAPIFVDQDGNYLFHFEKPFAFDAKGARTEDVELELGVDKQSGAYFLKLTVDPIWLNDLSRAYPITIDPTIVHDDSSDYATGTFNRSRDTGSGASPNVTSYYQELPADEHTIGLWHLNEASGNALDSSGNGNTGTPTGTTVVAGLLGNARSFNGTSDYVATGSLTGFSAGNSIHSVEAWIKPNAIPTTRQWPLLLGQAGSGSLHWTYNSTGLLYPGVWGVASCYVQPVVGEWNHVASVYDGDKLHCYLNGTLINSTTSTSFNFSATTLKLAQAQASEAFFNGSIDEVRISSIARSTEEIKASASRRPYSTYTSPTIDLGVIPTVSWNSFTWTELGVATGDGETLSNATGLVAQWNFNETSGTTADNSAGSCGATCDGTLTSFASTASQDQAPDTGWTSANRRWGAGALMFDGVDDTVDAGTTTNLKFTGDFSIEAWVKPSGSTVGQIVSNGTTGDWLYFFGGSTATSPICKIYQANSGNGYLQADGKTSIIDGKWHHVVCTLSGTTLSVYIDGVLDATSSTTTGTRDISSAGTFTIGKFTNTTSSYYSGTIDSVRAYSRALAPSEILSNYNATNLELQTRVGDTANPDDGSWEDWRPTTSESLIHSFDQTPDFGPVSYWPLDENSGSGASDVRANNHGTATSTTITAGKFDNGRSFAGSGYISVPHHSSLSFTGDFTLSAWVNKDTGANRQIISKTGAGGTGGYALLTGSTGEVYCRTDNGTTWTDSITGANWVTSSTGWTHVAAVKTGTQCRIYIDGIDRTTTSNTHTTVSGNTLPFVIGARADLSTEFWSGQIDDVRAYNHSLSASQIASLAQQTPTGLIRTNLSLDSIIKNEGSSALRLNSSSLQSDSSTVGLWRLDETSGTGAYFKDISGNTNHGTPTGTTTVKGINSQARSFNGSSDYITIPDHNSLDLPSTVTIEAWIKPTSLSGYQTIVAKRDASVYNYAFRMNNDSLNFFYSTTGPTLNHAATETGIIKANEWQHVAVTYNSSAIVFYVNGKVVTNTCTNGSCKGNMLTDTNPVVIGTANGLSAQYFTGNIDEVRISSTARPAEEISESYRMGRDHYLNQTIAVTNLTNKSSLPFYIAADRPGSYLSATIGESAYANYQPDSDTVSLWHLDEQTTGSNTPTYFDYDNFEAGPGSTDDWQLRNYNDPTITNETAFTGRYSLHMHNGWGRNFESGSGEPTTYPYDTNTYPYMCMAYKIPSGTIVNMLILIDTVGWRSITMTQGESPTSYAKVASWNPLQTDNTWQHKCINLDTQLDASLGTGTHNISAVIWHDGGGGPAIAGEFWIDDYIISSAPHHPHQNPAVDATGQSHNQLPDAPITATGGTVTYANGYTIHTFTSSGTFTVTSGTGNVSSLLIAGGGGGGGAGSGGGGGGYLYDNTSTVSPQAYTVTVGGGGAGGITAAAGAKGGNTTFNSLTAEGGGNGVTHGATAGGNGGSGGGGAIRTAAPTATGGTASQGNVGGAGFVESGWIGNSGGGGGAYTAGVAGGNTAGSGNGGAGRPFSLRGTTEWYSGGGGGGEIHGSFVGAGGVGGGGSAVVSNHGGSGTTNTGGGGAGGSYGYNGSAWQYYNGGNGGNGIAIIRYPTTTSPSQSNLIGTTTTEGKIGKARYFDGASYIATNLSAEANDLFAQSGVSWSVDAWFKNPAATASNQMIVGRGGGTGGSATFGIYVDTSGNLASNLRGTNTTLATGVANNQWHHVAITWDGTNAKAYLDGSQVTSPQVGTAAVQAYNIYIGATANGTSLYYTGAIDEVRVSKVARTADEIRQTYQVGARSHQVTIDFGAKLDAANLITGPGDLGFRIDATVYGLSAKGSGIYPGEKIIVRENYDGVEYISQGNVSAVNSSTGLINVTSWDSGSTLPSGGFTANADVFKWQREYFPLTGNTLASHLDSTALLSLRLTDGAEGRTIWLDDLKASDGYLTTPGGSTITSSLGSRYFQYRAITHSSDSDVSPSLTSTSLDYTLNSPPNTPTLDSPTDAATSVSLTPTLQTTATDTNGDYVRYTINLCTDFAMTIGCQTFDQTSSQTGWTGQNTQTSTAYTSGTQGSYTLQSALSANTTYYWQSQAIDPGGSNTWGDTQASPKSFTTNEPSYVPTLDSPANTATGVSLTPTLQTTGTDADSDYLRYEIILCTDLAMTTGCQTFDQTISQTGWTGQNTQTNTAYTSSTQASYTLQSSLSANTTYYWKSRAIDPGGTNSWSDTQPFPSSFTTNAPPTAPTSLLTEGATNPTAVIDITPEFSAIHNDPDGDSATHYQVEVNTASDFTGTSLWDSTQTSMSTTVSGAYSPDISYAGTTLSLSGETYYWRIKFWDSNSLEGAWSDVAQFKMSDPPHQPNQCVIEETVDDTTLTLKWLDVTSNEAGFEIRRSVNGGAFSLLQTVATNSTQYQDGAISQGNTYAYQVAAYVAGPIYGDWCTTNTLTLQDGTFDFQGVSLQGVSLQ